MAREKVRLFVELELDPVPGAFHTRDSAHEHVSRLLHNAIPHYNPIVSVDHDS